MSEYGFIGFFFLLGAAFVGMALIVSKLVAFTSPPAPKKHETYECSEDVIGDARIQFGVGYYIYALIFLVFDIEALFLFPCMRIFREVTSGLITNISIFTLFVEVFIFIFILFLGLVFVWQKGLLNWE